MEEWHAVPHHIEAYVCLLNLLALLFITSYSFYTVNTDHDALPIGHATRYDIENMRPTFNAFNCL